MHNGALAGRSLNFRIQDCCVSLRQARGSLFFVSDCDQGVLFTAARTPQYARSHAFPLADRGYSLGNAHYPVDKRTIFAKRSALNQSLTSFFTDKPHIPKRICCEPGHNGDAYIWPKVRNGL
eukprot:1078202-Pleurochrysis_carterae.AAC.4